MIPIAILAGGLATRLGAITQTVPKALISVADEPFVFHQLRLLRREGIERAVLCVGHLGEMIQDVVGDGRKFGLEVAYSFDGEKLLGTGGALRRALPLLGSTFFVLYGDSYLDIDYSSVLSAFRLGETPALMTVYRNDGHWDASNIIFDGHRIVCYDKRTPTPEMHYIDYGLGILTQSVLDQRPPGVVLDLAEVYTELVATGRLGGFEVEHRFYEVGSKSGLAETDTYLREK